MSFINTFALLGVFIAIWLVMGVLTVFLQKVMKLNDAQAFIVVACLVTGMLSAFITNLFV